MIRDWCADRARRSGVALTVDVVLLVVMTLHNPPNDPLQEIIANFSAVAKIDLLEAFGSVGHFQDGLGGDVPDGFHTPAFHIWAAGGRQSSKSFVADVEAVGDVDNARSWSYEGADVVDEDVVGY